MVCDWFSGMVDRRDSGNWVYFAKRRRWPNEGSRANRESSVLHSKTNNMLFMIHILAKIASTHLITFEAHFTLTSTAYASPNMALCQWTEGFLSCLTTITYQTLQATVSPARF